ncbi:MAG: SRPBCC family protein [Nitriliruptoraceae bacterium]
MSAIEIQGCWRNTAGVEDVWAVLVDLNTWSQWWPAISEVEIVEPTGTALAAARLTFSTRAPLRPLVATLHVVDQTAPSRLDIRIADGPLDGHGTFTIADDPEGSRSCYDVSLAVRSRLFRPLEPILRSGTRSNGRARLELAGEDLARLAGGEPLAPAR